jgi:hypothetical protein
MKSEKKAPSPIKVAKSLPAVKTAVRAGDVYLHNPPGSN